MADIVSLDNRQKLVTEPDGKEYRKLVANRAQELFDQLRLLLPSNYKSSVVGPNYTIYLKAFSTELAKFFIEMDAIVADLDINKTRPEFLYQIFGYLLKVDKQLKLSEFNDEDFRRFLLSLITLYFGGSTPANIKAGIEIFTQAPVTVRENYIDAQNPGSGFDISDQFGFQVDFEITDNIPVNFEITEARINALIRLIKPAHTLYETKLVFRENMDARQDIVEALRASDTFWQEYDDFRLYFDGPSGSNRLGFKTDLKVTGESLRLFYSTAYAAAVPLYQIPLQAQYGPLVKSGTFGTNLADTYDVVVKVNGSPVTVTSLEPVAGIIRATGPVIYPTSVVTLNYTWFNNPTQVFKLNSDQRLNGSRARFVLNEPSLDDPKQVQYFVTGYDRRYTVLLNDTFQLNERAYKVATNGRPSDQRFILNRSGRIVNNTTLNDETQVFERTFQGTGVIGSITGPSNWYGLSMSVSGINLGGTESLLSIASDSLMALSLAATGLSLSVTAIDGTAFFSHGYRGINNEPQFGFWRLFDGHSIDVFNLLPTAAQSSPVWTQNATQIMRWDVDWVMVSGPSGSLESVPLVDEDSLFPTAVLLTPTGYTSNVVFKVSDWTLTGVGQLGITGSYLFNGAGTPSHLFSLNDYLLSPQKIVRLRLVEPPFVPVAEWQVVPGAAWVVPPG